MKKATVAVMEPKLQAERIAGSVEGEEAQARFHSERAKLDVDVC